MEVRSHCRRREALDSRVLIELGAPPGPGGSRRPAPGGLSGAHTVRHQGFAGVAVPRNQALSESGSLRLFGSSRIPGRARRRGDRWPRSR